MYKRQTALNTLLLNCIFASGQLKEGELYDVDFDHQFIETEKYDACLLYTSCLRIGDVMRSVFIFSSFSLICQAKLLNLQSSNFNF